MITLDETIRACAPSLAIPTPPRVFTGPLGRGLTTTQRSAAIAEGRTMCDSCRASSTCRDFAYITRMPGFLAGTTEEERADVLADAHAFVVSHRAAAKTAGTPFTHTERDRVYAAALHGAHLTKVLAS